MAAIHGTLKQLRQSRGWTQEEVARQMSLTRQAVSSHESGRTQPDLETLKRYAEIYQVSIQDILYGGGQTQRQRRWVRRLAAAALADLVLCTLLQSVLRWVPNRFFQMPEGQVSQELLPVLQRHLALSRAAEAVEGFSLVSFGLLALLLTVLAARLEPPVPWKKQLAYLAALTAGTWLALLPWALTDPVFHPANYAITPALQLLWAGLLLVFSLLAGRFRHSLNA